MRSEVRILPGRYLELLIGSGLQRCGPFFIGVYAARHGPLMGPFDSKLEQVVRTEFGANASGKMENDEQS
jgi:hypothetical protein